MLRRIVNNEDLVIENIDVGKITRTKCALCYLEDITNPDLILFKRPLGLLFSSVKANSFKNTLSKKPLSIAGTLLNHSGNTNIISSLSFKCFWYFFY